MDMDDVKLAVSGQVEMDSGTTWPVTICSLSETHCQLDRPLAGTGEMLQLWLGAIGPLRAQVSGYSRQQLTFDGPIHPAIAAHFNALRA